MAVQFLPPPEKAVSALSSGLIDLKSTGFLAEDLSKISTNGELRIEKKFSHPVYYLALDDLVNFQGLDKAKLIGWAFFLSESVVAEAIVSSPPSEYKLGTVCKGSCTLPLSIFKQVTTDPRFQEDVFEARTLQLFDLHFSAVWLKSDRAAQDVFFPLGTSRELVENLDHLTLGDFKRLLIPAAVEKSYLIQHQGNLLA